MTHATRLEGDDQIGWHVVCRCGWRSQRQGQGNAYTTAGRGLADVGHAAFAQASA